MGNRNSRILQAGDYAIALTNYKKYIETRLTTSTTKRGSTGTPAAPVNRPRTKVAVKPYGIEAGGNGYKVVSASTASEAQLGTELTTRTKKDATTLAGADTGKGFTPAKVSIFVPSTKTGTSATYAKSKSTGMNYVKRPGVSYSYPHGATSDNEEYSAGVAAVRAALETKYTGYAYLRISFSNEKF